MQSRNKNPYKVPEGYFDSFPDRIIRRIKSQHETGRNAPLPKLKYNKIFRMTSAAAVVIIAILIGLIIRNKNHNVTENMLTNLEDTSAFYYSKDVIDENDLLGFFAENPGYITTAFSLNRVPLNELNNEELNELLLYEMELTTEDIVNYLDDKNISFENI